MAEPDLTEVKETTVANATSTCDKRHCKEMRKDKLPPYLRDRGTKSQGIIFKSLQRHSFLFIVIFIDYFIL